MIADSGVPRKPRGAAQRTVPGHLTTIVQRWDLERVPNAKLRMVSVSPLLTAESRKMA